MTELKINTKKWFWTFCTLHVVLWTVALTLVRKNLPFDTVEAIAWGNQWEWGYNKHPPFAPWLCAIAAKFSSSWSVYLLSQLAVVVAFWAVWRLAQRLVTPIQALASVFLLEGVIYYNLISPKINPTTMMTPVWALLMLVGYLAIVERKRWYWLVLGILGGISVLTKYEAPFVLLPIFLASVLTPEGRSQYKTWGPYATLIAFVVVLIPHVIWEAHTGFTELQYAGNSGAGDLHAGFVEHGWLAHLYYPFTVGASELGAIAGLLLLAVLIWKTTTRGVSTLQRSQWIYLLLLSLGPVALMLLVSLFAGDYLYPKWGTPFFSLLGLLIVAAWRPQFARRSWRWFITGVAIIGFGIWAGRIGYLAFGPMITGKAHPDAYFPGPAIATDVTELWHNTYHQPLRYVAGSHYLVANISVYSADKPIPYMGWSHEQSPWVNVADMRKQGAMFVWWVHGDGSSAIPADIAARFPTAQYIGVFTFQKSVNIKTAPIEFGAAFLPPALS